MSSPFRTAVGIACSEGSLAVGMTNADLDLEEAAVYGKYSSVVESITLRVEPDSSHITVVFKDIYQDWRFWRTRALVAGFNAVYIGSCTPTGVTWQVKGTLPEQYLPKI